MSIFWLIQHEAKMAKMAKAESEATGARASARKLRSHIAELEERIDQMALKCQALWEIVREATDLSDFDIEQRINEIDLRDGVADGKITKKVQQCGRCGRTVSMRHSRCLYCGETVKGGEVF
jgi:hypothetical protein